MQEHRAKPGGTCTATALSAPDGRSHRTRPRIRKTARFLSQPEPPFPNKSRTASQPEPNQINYQPNYHHDQPHHQRSRFRSRLLTRHFRHNNPPSSSRHPAATDVECIRHARHLPLPCPHSARDRTDQHDFQAAHRPGRHLHFSVEWLSSLQGGICSFDQELVGGLARRHAPVARVLAGSWRKYSASKFFSCSRAVWYPVSTSSSSRFHSKIRQLLTGSLR